MISVVDGAPRYNPEYYVFKHFSQFVRPGAVRLGTSGDWTGTALAFQNPPNGTSGGHPTGANIVVVVMNPHDEARALQLSVPGNFPVPGVVAIDVVLAPQSFNTFVV